MKDFIILGGVIIGALLVFFSKRFRKPRLFFYLGLFIISLSLAFDVPDMVRGFITGYQAGFSK